jgi:DNA-binding NarL/FixJ family response regulator
MKLRILLADDHEIVRRGLYSLLQKHEGWEVCGEASDGREAIRMAQQLKPDVVIVDIGMPHLNGLDTTRQLIQLDPNFKVIVLTITDSDQVIREALKCRRTRICAQIRRRARSGVGGGSLAEQAHVFHATSE